MGTLNRPRRIRGGLAVLLITMASAGLVGQVLKSGGPDADGLPSPVVSSVAQWLDDLFTQRPPADERPTASPGTSAAAGPPPPTEDSSSPSKSFRYGDGTLVVTPARSRSGVLIAFREDERAVGEPAPSEGEQRVPSEGSGAPGSDERRALESDGGDSQPAKAGAAKQVKEPKKSAAASRTALAQPAKDKSVNAVKKAKPAAKKVTPKAQKKSVSKATANQKKVAVQPKRSLKHWQSAKPKNRMNAAIEKQQKQQKRPAKTTPPAGKGKAAGRKR